MRKLNEQPLAAILKELVSSPKFKKPFFLAKIQAAWEPLMGKTISGYTKEISISRNTLYISIESASLRDELGYGKEAIKLLLNEELGEDYLKDVVIR